MNETYTSAGLKSLFQYPVQGKEWGRKMLYLGLFWLAGTFVPVVPWLFALGYFAEIARRFAGKEVESGLPEWTDWNGILMDGLRVLGGFLIVGLPTAVIFFLGFSFYMGSTLSMAGLSEAGREGLGLLTMTSGMLVFFCTMAVGLVLSLGLGMAAAPAVTHMVVKKDFTALFRVKEWWPILRANLGGYLIAFFIILGLEFALQLLTQFVIYSVVLCGLLPILLAAAAAYIGVVSAVVFGEAYRVGQAKLEMDANELPALGD